MLKRNIIVNFCHHCHKAVYESDDRAIAGEEYKVIYHLGNPKTNTPDCYIAYLIEKLKKEAKNEKVDSSGSDSGL